MEGGKSFVAAVMVLLFIMPMLGSSTRQPLGGGAGALRALIDPGKQKRVGGMLWCCDKCDYVDSMNSYMCLDRTAREVGCSDGCQYCTCEHGRYATCICYDSLDSCPEPCSDDEPSSETGTPAAPEHHLRTAGGNASHCADSPQE